MEAAACTDQLISQLGCQFPTEAGLNPRHLELGREDLREGTEVLLQLTNKLVWGEQVSFGKTNLPDF